MQGPKGIVSGRGFVVVVLARGGLFLIDKEVPATQRCVGKLKCVMTPFPAVRSWLEKHGYRDLVPRRDASKKNRLYYTFVHEQFRRIGVPSEGGMVQRKYVERIKREGAKNEEKER